MSGVFSDCEAVTPFDLPKFTIYLPGRAARDSLRQEFLQLSPAKATLLPRIRVLGADADEPDFVGAAVPRAPGELERRLVLTRLVLEAAGRLAASGDAEVEPLYPNFTPAEAFAMAGSLITLLDEVETEGKPVSALLRLAGDAGAEQDQLSRRLLSSILRAWQGCLKSEGWISPAARRNLLLEREASALTQADGPVIVAGSTGSIPATLNFMRGVLALPRGFLVLPGLDKHSGDRHWQAIHQHPEHPQYGLAQLLRNLNLAREDVQDLPTDETEPHFRGEFLREAMRPSSTMDRWAGFVAEHAESPVPPTLSLPVIEAETPQDEAEVIAHIVRGALETPDRTIAVVTPDTKLRNRIAGLMQRWGIAAEQNARPESERLCGALAKCLADDDAVALVFLLKHIAGAAGTKLLRCITLLEAASLRQSWLPASIARFPEAVARTRAAIDRKELRHPLFTQAAPEEWEAVAGFAQAVAAAVSPLLQRAKERLPFARWLDLHHESLTALAAPFGEGAVLSAFQGATEDLANLRRIAGSRVASINVALGDYAALLAGLEAARPQPHLDLPHPRVGIWTPLDARLQSADLIVLAGLNEGCWPESGRANPWLNLAERRMLGLPPPERRLGQAAHDFASLAQFGDVVLTRAKKMDGAQCRPSRWLVRIGTLAAGMGLREGLEPETPWLHWARGRSRPGTVTPVKRPEPRPPVAARPRRLSVTAIETWLANPYAIYAQHILRLHELRQPGLSADARERGTLIHHALNEFTRRFPANLPSDTQAELMRFFDAASADMGEHPRLLAFWRPRFERFAAWFAETEPSRREGVARVLSEVGGRLELDVPAGPFTITARADRIDLGEDGGVRVYDYKTSSSAINTAMRRDAPQLALEGLLTKSNAFAGVPAAVPAAMSFILTAGGDDGGRCVPLKDDLATLVETAEKGLREHIRRFDQPETAYLPMTRARFADKSRFDPYAHLARSKEWSLEAGAEGSAP